MSALVGLFDSGLGGLTVLRRLQERYPHSCCLYLGDTARVPYGQRSVAEILSMLYQVGAMVGQAQQAMERIAAMQAQMQVVALAAAALPRRPRVYFEEWDEPPISAIRWVSELMGIAGGALLPLVYGYFAHTSGDSQLAYWVMLPCYAFILFYAFKGHKIRQW